LESHGAIWQLLLHPSTQLQKQDGANGTCGAADAGTAQQLVSLLQLDSSSVQQLQRQVVVLQLMADAQRAAGGQQRLWGKQVRADESECLVVVFVKKMEARGAVACCAFAPGAQGKEPQRTVDSVTTHTTTDVLLMCLQVQSALRKLAAQLKEMDVSAGRRTHTAAGGKSSLSSRGSDADSEDEHADGAAEPPLQQQQRADIEQHLGHRRSAQLQPAALRLVKELLSQGGGKTD
jgi:hypothetical protein